MREIEAAERFRDAHLTRLAEMVGNYVGDSYRDDMPGTWSENQMFEFIRMTTGRVVFDNPKWRVKSESGIDLSGIAKAMEYGMNRWSRKSKLRRLLKRVYASQCFSFSAVMTIIEPAPWMDPRTSTMPYWPQCYMLESDRFFFDPLCAFFGGARYVGHKFVRDKDDLIDEAKANKEAGWNQDIINNIAKNTGIDEFHRAGKDGDINRNEIVLYEIWVPEVAMGDPEQGYHGCIYTLVETADGTTDDFIREPRAYYGPRTGPYTLFGVYPVPGDPYPLSPFAATRMQGQELNDTTRGVNKAIREYKRLVVCSAENPDLAMKLKKPDNVVIMVKGFDKNQVQQLELGGVTDQHLKQLDIMLARVDRNTGISETHRGQIQNATATEIAVADSSAEASMSYIKQEFTDAVVQVGEGVGHALLHDDRIQFPLGSDLAQQMGMGQPWFMGGRTPGQDDMGFEFEIEPYSMERINEALVRAQYSDMMQLALAAAPIIPTAPFYDWKKLFEKGGEVMNDPAFGEFYIPQAGQQAQQQVQMQSQMEQAQMAGGVQVQQAQVGHTHAQMQTELAKPFVEAAKLDLSNRTLQQKEASDRAALKTRMKSK